MNTPETNVFCSCLEVEGDDDEECANVEGEAGEDVGDLWHHTGRGVAGPIHAPVERLVEAEREALETDLERRQPHPDDQENGCKHKNFCKVQAYFHKFQSSSGLLSAENSVSSGVFS